MTARSFRRSIALCISILGVVFGVYWTYSCGPLPDFDKYRITYVEPTLLNDTAVESYTRTLLLHTLVLREDLDVRESDSETDANIREWSASYFNERVPYEGVYWLVYKSTPSELDLTRLAVTDRTAIPVPDSTAVHTAREYLRQFDELNADNHRQRNSPYFTERREQAVEELRTEERRVYDGELALRFLVDKADVQLLDYLRFAKQCESVDWQQDPWEPVSSDTSLMIRLLDSGSALHNRCRSQYLRLRYAYQLVRLAQYANQPDRALKLYDELVTPNPAKSLIRSWAMGHRAGALRALGRYPESVYWFARQFDADPSRRELALRDIPHTWSPALWDSTLAFAHSDHERAVLWMVRAIREYRLSIDALRNIYRLEPDSPMLEALLIRELGRVERFLYDDRQTRDFVMPASDDGHHSYHWDRTENGSDWMIRRTGPPYGWDTLVFTSASPAETVPGAEYVQSFREFVESAGQSTRIRTPALWSMAAGYLDLMNRHFDRANDELDHALSIAGDRYELRHQIQLLRYLSNVIRGSDVGTTASDAYLSALQWYRSKQDSRYGRWGYPTYDHAMMALGRNYLIHNDVPHAILAFNAADDETTRNVLLDIYSSDDELARLYQMVSAGGADSLERRLLGEFSLDTAALLDLRGTRLLREGRFRDALALFERIPEGHWNSDGSDSTEWRRFESDTDHQIMDNYFGTGPQTNYTKLSLTRALVDQLSNAARGTNPSDAYARIANLLFNTPFWGYADVVWNGDWTWEMRFSYVSPDVYPFNIDGVAQRMDTAQDRFMRQYGSRLLAGTYYRKAMQSATNPEKAARYAWLADYCLVNPQTSLHETTRPPKREFAGFAELSTRLRSAKFARQILSQCEVYRGWIAGTQ